MKFIPHDYQKYAVRYIEEHPVAAVLLDMGLGKTVITLTALNALMFDSFKAHRVLVIAPLRVARQVWSGEIAKWDHLKDLRCSVAVGTEKERLEALKTEADIYVINRENVQWLVENVPFDFDTVVVDELSSFKNHQSKRFRALMKVRPFVKRIVGLTGTPAGNGLMDLWAEYKLLDMGKRLGRFISRYRAEFFAPDKANGGVVYSYRPLPGAGERIYERIADITVSMKATERLDMPDLISTAVPVYMSEYEREVYGRLKDEFLLDLPGGQITASNAGVLCGKLCQLANGAVYGDLGGTLEIHERKLDALEDIIESMNGRPLLVAYWFKHDLERIEERLHKLHVPFSRLDTEVSIRRWNAGELPVALIHPASAGHGLNLQSGGHTLVWYGLTWSLELYQQTVARLWRQGQRSGTVVVQHIVTHGTIDENILTALRRKDATQAALIEAVKASI